MKLPRFFLPVLFSILVSSCGKTEKPPVKLALKKPKDLSEVIVPIDKGFSEYIAGYTSGIVTDNSLI